MQAVAMEMIMMDLQIDRAGNWKKIDRMTAQERGRQRERERERSREERLIHGRQWNTACAVYLGLKMTC